MVDVWEPQNAITLSVKFAKIPAWLNPAILKVFSKLEFGGLTLRFLKYLVN